MKFTENDILVLTDASTIKNAKTICNKNNFMSLGKSEDGTFYVGDCKGSGSKSYIVSADFINSDTTPTFRCDCPSRKFPCKHSIALMYEILNEKEFDIIEIPEDILKKREKKENREKKAKEKAQIPQKPKKVNKFAKIKKINKQLEGLDFTEKIITDMLKKGLGSLTNNSDYKSLAKQLGDYYLPGVQEYIYDFIQKSEEEEIDYDYLLKILVKVNSLIKKSREYLNNKLETENFEDDESELYEELGGIWTLERLKQLGLQKENSNFIQLYFYIKKGLNEFVDTGYYIDCETGELVVKYNFRPFKVKNLQKDDSIFNKISNSTVVYYPGNVNRRVRFDDINFEELHEKDFINIIDKAKDLKTTLKLAKDYLKNTLSDDFILVNVSFNKIGMFEDKYILQDNDTTIQLKNMELETTKILKNVSSDYYKEKSSLFGRMFYDSKENSLNIEPLSIVTKDKIIRL